MATCVFCGAETSLYQSGQAICVECSDLIDAGKQPRKKPAAKESRADEEKTGTAE